MNPGITSLPRDIHQALPPVRIIFCSSGGHFGALVLRALLDSKKVEITAIVLSARVIKPQYSFIRGAWEQYRRSGAAYSFYLWCATSLCELLGKLHRSCSVSALAAAHAIPMLVTRNLNDDAGHVFLQDQQADLIVSAFFNQKLMDSAVAIPKAGAVNLHPSLLPEFKGVDPVFFTRLSGVKRIGVTVHRVANELDVGHVLAQDQVIYSETESVFSATARLFQRGAELLLRRIEDIALGIPGQPQQGVGNYDSWPTSDQVRQLYRQGTRLLTIADLLRAAKPFAGV